MKARTAAQKLTDSFSFEAAIEYYKRRGGVLFLNIRNHWEQYSQPPTNLARALAEAGVRVVWIERAPRYPRPVELLEVKGLWTIRGRSLPLVTWLDGALKLAQIKRQLKKMGGLPVIWLQEYFPDYLVKQLPYVDVYSYFDDLRLATPQTALYQVPRLLTAQNKEAGSTVGGPRTIHTFRPALDLEILHGEKRARRFRLPGNFPKIHCGYVGSLYAHYFDFDALEILAKALPEMGFVLAGRTDAAGCARMEALKVYPNVIYLGSLKREELGPVWRTLQALILLYRPQQAQRGAFAIKGIEALSFGVPVTGLLEPKTREYQEYFPMARSLDELIRILPKVVKTPKAKIQHAFEALGYLSSPQYQLTEIARLLSAPIL